MDTDIEIMNHGSIVLFRPVSGAAKAWLENVTDGQWFGGALVVEHRYAVDLVIGARELGFTLGG